MKRTSKKSLIERATTCTAIVFLLVFLSAGHSQATPLNLTLLSSPDISSSFINVNYSAGSDGFFASGFAITLDAHNIAGGTFDLTAIINNVGALTVPGGTLAIGGTVASLGFNSGTLLTGNLGDFGFNPAGGDPLEFLFDVTGGDAAGLFGGVGSNNGGVILVNTGFGGNFGSDFASAPFGALSDTAPTAPTDPVPEPATMLLLGTGLVGVAGAARRRKKK